MSGDALILHHYDISPYSEKIRLIFGLKGLAWRSVQIPVVMPKPDLTCLTGGYRKTPVLQIGADIYCDTQCIARALEARQPTPTLYPAGRDAANRALASWGESIFLHLIMMYFGLGGVFDEAFIADRQQMVPGGVDVNLAKSMVAPTRDQIRAKLATLDAELGARGPFLLGDAPALADFAVYHPLWAAPFHPDTQALLAPYTSIAEWMARIATVGHGTPEPMDSGDAVAVARNATSTTAERADPHDPNGRRPGARVRVMPDDYGRDPVDGVLVASDAHEIAIRRDDERAGTVVVHFPREGFLVFDA